MYPRNLAATLLLRTLFGLTVFASTNLSAQMQDALPATTFAPALTKEPTGSLTLSVAIDLALTSNPELSAAANELGAVEGAVIQAGVLPNPEISTSVEDTQNKATRTTTIQVSQRIELGGKRSARITSAERGRDVAAADLAAKRLDVRATVIGAFFDVLVAQERVQQAEDLLSLAQRASQAASRRVTAGKISPVEETKARVAEASARVELNQAQRELVTARKRVAASWGSSTPRFEKAEGRTDVLPPVRSAEEIKRRLNGSPALLRARHEADRFSALADLERSRRIPDVTFSLGSKKAEELGRNQTIVGVSIPFPIFDRNQGNVLEAQKRADKARDELSATELRLGTEVTQNEERLKALVVEAQTLQSEIMPGARSAYEAASKGFELGKFSFLEVLDAQRTFFQARAQYLRSLSDAHRTAAELERILGSFDSMSSAAPSRP
ncbi:cobalt-zinc-cadmium resistance protein [Dechloromonas denitrificans]|jgi:cobalt-zinc-cadmium efflux system outer membrane protein|uniref:Cobalt-zinc-cadmium resistance protein n=1 Tax=Dechloromonas denitrificans TaxID=281362 RepID=A0A133XLB6_9RHOO|nr:TolC family protein [Dechloromonas denitrificans]KXB31735.1 cobalt-zinc-cadmium resistance protein [Dechloromonas denitrificans]